MVAHLKIKMWVDIKEWIRGTSKKMNSLYAHIILSIYAYDVIHTDKRLVNYYGNIYQSNISNMR